MLGRSVRAVGVVLGGLRGEAYAGAVSVGPATWTRTRKWGRICGGMAPEKVEGRGITRGLMTSTTTCGAELDMEEGTLRRIGVKSDGGISQRITKAALDNYDTLRTTYPDLEVYSRDELMTYLGFMSTYSFNEVESAEILTKCPSLISSYREKIPAVIGWLQNASFKETEMTSLIHRHPGMVYLKRSHFSKRIGFLNTYLSLSETHQVMQNSIGALVDHESVVQKKLEYLIIYMSHATRNIVSCRVLDHKYSRIRMRHEFLIRAGLYRPIAYRKLIKVQEKERNSKEKRQKYFTPYDIVCSNDPYFLKYCTKGALTANELVAFEELFEKEVASEDEVIVEDEGKYEDDHEQEIVVTVDQKKQSEADQFYY